MYCAFAVLEASVVSCSAPELAGAVASATKFTAPPGRVSAVDQPCVFAGVTTTVSAAAATPTATARLTAAMHSAIRLLIHPLLVHASPKDANSHHYTMQSGACIPAGYPAHRPFPPP